jgi:uncharacterized membrane protein YphA (DoxX/SURF4 family)
VIKLIVAWLPIALGVVMIGTGAANFAGPPLALKNFALWGYPPGFHRVAGSLSVVLGLLLIVPMTAQVGAIGSAIFMLVAIVTLIRSHDWAHLPGAAVLMAALAPAIMIQHRT